MGIPYVPEWTHYGLRVTEAVSLTLHDIDLKSKQIHIHRLKGSDDTRQPLYNGEVAALNVWLKVRNKMQPHSNWLFISERRKPLSRFTVCVLIRKYAEAPLAWRVSRSIRICCGTLPDILWLTEVLTLG